MASWPAYRFSGDRWVWYFHLFQNFPQFVGMQIVKVFSLVNETEVNIFMVFSCFFYGHTDVAILISGSSAFSKFNLYIWKFSTHVLLKSNLKDFEHYLVNWIQLCCKLNILWHCLSLGLEWKLTFPVLWPCWIFPIFWHFECSTLQ